ncbi:putative N-acetyltransferase 16 [Leptodactylus fuscus]|uniref:putative N-acetyltransferase 16 n=1 Tax=Leptodactylus fuscus TaxID=238119 RepID=UPI003F4EF669
MSNETSFSQINFVAATAEDYEEVMSISGGIYNGMDYLPFKYHAWLKDPQRRTYLAKCEGKVVGFESFILVDDGTTAVVEGLRVAPWMRGRGVAGLIQKFCLDTLQSNHPKVKRVRLTRAEDPPASMLMKYKVISSKALVSVLIAAEKLDTTIKLLESRVNNLDISNLSVLGAEEILRFFEESKSREDLLPGGLIIQDCRPFSMHKSNLNFLLKQKIVWIYSHLGDSSGLTDSSKAKATSGDSHAYLEGFLSLGTPPFPVPLAEGIYRLDIDMFGNDPFYAKIHVLEQLKIGVRALPAGGGVACFLYADESLRTELGQLCEGLTPFYVAKEQLILEMEI